MTEARLRRASTALEHKTAFAGRTQSTDSPSTTVGRRGGCVVCSHHWFGCFWLPQRRHDYETEILQRSHADFDSFRFLWNTWVVC